MMCQLAHALRFCFILRSANILRSFPTKYADILFGRSEPRESWKSITNSSGTFYMDSDSFLMDFQPSEENLMAQQGWNVYLKELDIPTDVNAIPGDLFCDFHIQSKISFPDTLKWIGCACDRGHITPFNRCHFPDMLFPRNLELLAPNSFYGCHIRSRTIGSLPKSFSLSYWRRFKDCRIAEIRVPLKYRNALCDVCGELGNYCISGEISDPDLGTLFYMKDEKASMGWGNFMERLFQKISEAGAAERRYLEP